MEKKTFRPSCRPSGIRADERRKGGFTAWRHAKWFVGPWNRHDVSWCCEIHYQRVAIAQPPSPLTQHWPAKVLKDEMLCREYVIDAVTEGALTLLNLTAAIQQKASLDAAKENNYEVVSRKAKKKRKEKWNALSTKLMSPVAAQTSDTTKSASTPLLLQKNWKCWTDIWTSFLNKQRSHANRICISRSLRRQGGGRKKGSPNKYPYRSPPSVQQASSSSTPCRVYSEINHNDNSFVLRIRRKEAKKNASNVETTFVIEFV